MTLLHAPIYQKYNTGKDATSMGLRVMWQSCAGKLAPSSAATRKEPCATPIQYLVSLPGIISWAVTISLKSIQPSLITDLFNISTGFSFSYLCQCLKRDIVTEGKFI